MAEINFDASTVEPSASYEPLPAGKYNVQVVESEMKPTKDGTGQYLWLKLEVLDDGEYKGRFLFDRLNIENRSPDAVDIARRKLSALCRACGKMAVADSEELHWHPFAVKISVRQGSNGYDPSNEVKGYFPSDGNSGPVPAAPRAAAPTQTQGMKPWEAAKLARQGA